MKEYPLISIVLPTYNVEKYIKRCVESLLNQTVNNYEIIFVDDKGNDNSIKIINPYVKKHNNIKIITNEKNLGTFHSRRIGVNNAKGKYVIFIDPDDEIEKNFLDCFTDEEKE